MDLFFKPIKCSDLEILRLDSYLLFKRFEGRDVLKRKFVLRLNIKGKVLYITSTYRLSSSDCGILLYLSLANLGATEYLYTNQTQLNCIRRYF